MATSAFWLISFGHAAALLTVSAVMVHLVPHLTEGLGFSLSQAALVITLVTGCQLIGQLGGGVLGDRLDKRLLCIICMVAHTVALLILAYASSSLEVVIFAVLHGLALGGSWATDGGPSSRLLWCGLLRHHYGFLIFDRDAGNVAWTDRCRIVCGSLR